VAGAKKMKTIRDLVWDIDGTLYRSTIDLLEAIRHETYRRIALNLNIPYEKAKEKFLDLYAELGGATATILRLGLDRRLIQDAVDSVDKTRYVKRDQQLLEMFEVALKNFTHVIVTNTSRRGTMRTLEILGLSPDLFRGIVTADDVVRSKPDTEPFERALAITGHPASEHVSIGDREKVDIVPAKALGMKTIFVWGVSQMADASVLTVYDVPRVLENWKD
jgi:HAD superfamily hydrolase (TIGR01549 family)